MIQKLKQRAETGALVMVLVIPLALCVFAFLGVAGYFAFRESLPPDLAALVTAAAGIVLIAVILIIAKLVHLARGTRSSSSPSAKDFELGDEMEAFLRDHADPVLSDWVRGNPDKAALTTLALGVAAGYSGRFRSVLLDVYERYAESEQVRRARRG